MKFLFLFLICPLSLAAQPVSISPKQIIGLWKGYFTTTDLSIPYELVFSEENGNITGWSYTTFTVGDEEIVTMKKLAVSLTGSVTTEDDNDVYNNFPKKQLIKIKQINKLLLQETTASSKLTGTFETITPRNLKPARGNVFLEKKNTPDSSGLIAKMDELGLTRTLSFSFNAPPVMEPEAPLIVVNEKPVPEKPIVPPVSAKVPDRDTVETVAVAVVTKPVPVNADVAIVIKPAPVNVPVVTSIPAKKIEPEIKKESPVVVKAPVKDNVVLPEKATPKTDPQVIAAKPRRDTIFARPQPSVPVAKAKVADPVVKKIPPPVAVVKPVPNNLPDNIAIAPAIDLRNRKIEIIDELTIMADSLQFTLYDNGEVDGDTVSIILNGKTIVSRQGLSTRPFTKTVYLTRDMGDSVQLIMYAENLGTIAPNTGLMIVNYDNKRREIRFSGDLSKNAAITLRRTEQE